MKKIILAALITFPAITWAQGGFTINGKMGVTTPELVYLTYKAEGKNVLDSAILKDGSFQFKGTVAGPTMSRLYLKPATPSDPRMRITPDNKVVFLENTVINVASKDSLVNATISGSPLNQEFSNYIKTFKAQEDAMAALNAEYAAATPEKRNDPAFSNDLRGKFQIAAEEKENLQKKYIAENPNSHFSLLALQEIAGSNMDIEIIEPIYKKLSDGVRSSADGVQFAKLIDQQRLTSIGAVAPEFTQNDPNDKPVKLSDFRGKYVLLDFWASWCGPCRAENPNVVKAYNTYKDKNFTVLGVSLDNPGKKDAWLAAVEKDGLTWTQLSDLKGWDNEVSKLYGVRGIPQNYLIDPQGLIVGKNLRGEELEKKLAEVIK